MLAIDFVAHHDIQAQAAQSIFDELSGAFDCRWLVGPDQVPSGAAAGILIDHADFQPRIRRSLSAYRYLFHILHDLADFPVYEAERDRIRTCDLVLVPGPMHAQCARKSLGADAPIHEIGWPKYDRMTIPPQHEAFDAKLKSLPHELTILYTPTWAFTYEWLYLLPLLRDLPCNTILKNHIYVNPGQPMPAGSGQDYVISMRSADEMEAAIESYACNHMIVAPRTLNVCSLFPYAQVAIADRSSVLAEFLPFGVSIETGRYDPDENHCEPEISRYFPEVAYLRRAELVATLSSWRNLNTFLNGRQPPSAVVAHGAGIRAAALIRKRLEEAEGLSSRIARGMQRSREELTVFIDKGVLSLRRRFGAAER
ncbi:MAG TPA: hypothetical protein VEK79_02335 [Thermoanaerobaculia bacterium]|nr:hypothetical protein [Thermoanaerobaculia bacterium]